MPGDDLRRKAMRQARARYPHAMAGYLLWLRDRWGDLARSLPEMRRGLRDRAFDPSGYGRTADIYAALCIGLRLGLQYAQESGAITESYAASLRAEGEAALDLLAREQSNRVTGERGSTRFLEVLAELLSSGAAYLNPPSGERAGKGPGRCLGWYDDDFLYLSSTLAHAEVAETCRKAGTPFTVTPNALHKQLMEEGALIPGSDGSLTPKRRHRVTGLTRAIIIKRSALAYEPPPDDNDA